jgi:hypothetical protein
MVTSPSIGYHRRFQQFGISQVDKRIRATHEFQQLQLEKVHWIAISNRPLAKAIMIRGYALISTDRTWSGQSMTTGGEEWRGNENRDPGASEKLCELAERDLQERKTEKKKRNYQKNNNLYNLVVGSVFRGDTVTTVPGLNQHPWSFILLSER